MPVWYFPLMLKTFKYFVGFFFLKLTFTYLGVRAVLVDRDNQPKWSPANLDQVDLDKIERYFSNLSPEEELKLP